VQLEEWILADFMAASLNFEASFVRKLLLKLSDFFLFYSLSADEATAADLRAHHQTVKRATELIRILFAMTFLEEVGHQVDTRRRSQSFPTKKAKAKGTQRESKQALKAAKNRATLDEGPFLALGHHVPSTRSEADAMSSEVFQLLHSILEVCQTSLRSLNHQT